MPVFRIPTPLRSYTDEQTEINVEGDCISEAINDLVQKYPKLKQHLLNEDNELLGCINLYLNNEDIRYLSGLETFVDNKDNLMIIPGITGG